MKKIKLDSGKLKLKKESIGSLMSKDHMGRVFGGDQQPSQVGVCNSGNAGCVTAQPGCTPPPSGECPPSTIAVCVTTILKSCSAP